MTPAASQSLVLAFAKLDKLAFATALGTVSGLIVAIATLWIAVKGGERAGQNLQMLGQFFQGYTVTVSGACRSAQVTVGRVRMRPMASAGCIGVAVRWTTAAGNVLKAE